MTDTPKLPSDDETTDLEELSDEGLGATIGEKDTFEPEESEGAPE